MIRTIELTTIRLAPLKWLSVQSVRIFWYLVKMTFAKGALLPDPSGLFNASLEGKLRRAIDVHEGDAIDARALKALIRAAVKLNAADRAGR